MATSGFGKAFREARAAGDKTFTFNGKKYTTDLAPAVRAGVTAVMEVSETTTTLVAATPPKVTLVAPVKFAPLIVTVVPPKVVPDVGLNDAIVGAGISYVNALTAVALPTGVVPNTSC